MLLEGITRQILSLVKHASEVLASASVMACVDNDRRAVHIGQGWRRDLLKLPPFVTCCTIWAPLPQRWSLLARQREILVQSTLRRGVIISFLMLLISKWVLEVRIEGVVLSLKLFELTMERLGPLTGGIITTSSLKSC